MNLRKNRKQQIKTNTQTETHLEKALATLKTVKPTFEQALSTVLVDKPAPKPQLVLFGDSSIDNNAYVERGQDVTSYVERKCPDWEVVKRAWDGAIIQSVHEQESSEHRWACNSESCAVVSVGGNDAVKLIRQFTDDTTVTFLDAMVDLTTHVMKFSLKYNHMIQSLRGSYKGVALCTIYRPNFADRALNEVATTLLPSFNQVIRDAARNYNCTLIDNFSIIDPCFIVNNIEPGGAASGLIAGAIQSATKLWMPKKEQAECPKNLPA